MIGWLVFRLASPRDKFQGWSWTIENGKTYFYIVHTPVNTFHASSKMTKFLILFMCISKHMTRIIKDDTDIFMLSRIIEHHMTSLTLDRKAPQAPTLIPGDKSKQLFRLVRFATENSWSVVLNLSSYHDSTSKTTHPFVTFNSYFDECTRSSNGGVPGNHYPLENRILGYDFPERILIYNQEFHVTTCP